MGDASGVAAMMDRVGGTSSDVLGVGPTSPIVLSFD
jgi:hypothetical protein